MAITIPTQEQITIDMLAEITESLDKREGSLIRTCISPIAWYLNKFYNDLAFIEKQSYLETAEGEYLEKIVATRGITRNKATYAVRRGVFNRTVPVHTEFTALNGSNNLVYAVTSFIEQVGDEYFYRLTCLTEGTIGNNYTGNLQANVFVDGLNKAIITDIIQAGEEIETDASLRERYIDTLNEKSFGGNIASYQYYLSNRSGVGPVEIFPFWKGGGTVLISILNSSYEIPDDLFVADLQTEICPPEADNATPSANGYGLAPIGALVTITKPQTFDINVSVSVMRENIDLSIIKESITTSINNYLMELRKTFGTSKKSHSIVYGIDVIYAKIYTLIFNTAGVLNIKDLTINDLTADLNIDNTAENQYIPVLKELNVYEYAS